jgi:hypothetical protein
MKIQLKFIESRRRVRFQVCDYMYHLMQYLHAKGLGFKLLFGHQLQLLDNDIKNKLYNNNGLV